MVYNINVYDSTNKQIDQLVQWDKDVYLYIKEDSIVSAQPVHWCHQGDTEAIVTTSTYSNGALKVKVPNVILRDPRAIYMYVYINIDSGYRSVYRARVNVIQRPQPGDYVYEDTPDYISVQAVIEEATRLADDAKTARDIAVNAADTAVDAASRLILFSLISEHDGNGNVTVKLGSTGNPDDVDGANQALNRSVLDRLVLG